MTTKEKADKLELWGPMENTELGEVWGYLVELYSYRSDYISPSLHNEIGDEIIRQYNIAVDMIEDGEFEVE